MKEELLDCDLTVRMPVSDGSTYSDYIRGL